MYSMTGYGKSVYSSDGLEISVELKSVNNRFLDLSSKYPRSFISFDDTIRKAVQSKISRGRVDLFVTYNDNRDKEVELKVDLSLAKGYYNAATLIKDEIKDIENDFSLTSLVRMPDVVSQQAVEVDAGLEAIVKQLVLDACDRLNEMRHVEGEKLKLVILNHLQVIEQCLDDIEKRAPLIQVEYRERLRERVAEYLEDVKIDESKLLNEVAFFADKSNIDEEISRLHSHIEQFKLICENDTVGRKLDFLIQEFNREANTICSKANDIVLTTRGLELKCEIEKIREQIQNLE